MNRDVPITRHVTPREAAAGPQNYRLDFALAPPLQAATLHGAFEDRRLIIDRGEPTKETKMHPNQGCGMHLTSINVNQ